MVMNMTSLQIIAVQTGRLNDAMEVIDDCNKPQHHYADGMTADSFFEGVCCQKLFENCI